MIVATAGFADTLCIGDLALFGSAVKIHSICIKRQVLGMFAALCMSKQLLTLELWRLNQMKNQFQSGLFLSRVNAELRYRASTLNDIAFRPFGVFEKSATTVTYTYKPSRKC